MELRKGRFFWKSWGMENRFNEYLLVVEEGTQQRDVGGFRAEFLMVLFLNSLGRVRYHPGRHIAPSMAQYD